MKINYQHEILEEFFINENESSRNAVMNASKGKLRRLINENFHKGFFKQVKKTEIKKLKSEIDPEVEL